MASIRTRPRKDGISTYTVNWRDPEKGLKSRTYTDEEKAVELRDFLDGNGNSFKLAAEAKRTKASKIPSVSDVVNEHIDLLRKPQAGTIAKYRRMAKAHIDGTTFGNMAVDRVDRPAVTAWLDSLTVSKGANVTAGEPLGRKTKQNVHALVSAAFRTAVEAMPPRMSYNPAKGIAEADKNEAREPVYLSPEDLDMLAERIAPHYALFIRVLSKTGLRYSEATALRKRDVRVDDGRAVIQVRRAWKSIGRGEEIGPPKTKKAKRNVTCSQSLSAELAEHMKPLAADDLLFTRPEGGYLRNSSFHKETWQPLVNGLVSSGELDRKPWIHEIRHAHTTHLLKKGVPIHIVQARLGHEDPQTTLRVYSRLARGDDAEAADALE